MESSTLYADLEQFWRLYKADDFGACALHMSTLLRRTLIELYIDYESNPPPASNSVSVMNNEQRASIEITSANLRQLISLLSNLRVFDLTSGSEPERQVLKTYNLEAIGDLADLVIKSEEPEHLKMYLFFLGEFLYSVLSFKNWIDTEAVGSIVEKKFLLDTSTGILTHPVDLSRNVSFKAVTFGVMLGHICSQIVEQFLIKDATSDTWHNLQEMEEQLNDVLYRAGYDAGSNFGRALLDELSLRHQPLSKADKISTWCLFDTSVGWGRFENNLTVDEEISVKGKITLHSNFLIMEREAKDFNICSLMKGYIAGVLGQLLEFRVLVRHDKLSGDCGQFLPSKDGCDFVISAAP